MYLPLLVSRGYLYTLLVSRGYHVLMRHVYLVLCFLYGRPQRLALV